MSAAAVEEPKTEKPVVFRLWVAIQKLSRLRDNYSRDQTTEGRLAAAKAMMKLADEVHELTGEVLTETETAARAA